MMWMCLIWLAYFLSLFQSNLSASYQGSRTIYTQNATKALCTNYIDVTFNFDNATNEVIITIFSSTNTSWFGIGLPDPSLYYDPAVRKDSVMNGYAIIYIGDEVKEYTITSTADNSIDSMTPQPLQNIAVDSIVNSAGTVTITVRRNLTTPDPNDFTFNLAKYEYCHPFLLTVAIGNALTFDNINTFGSSFIYIYETALLADTSTYTQNWTHTLGGATLPFSITFGMDPLTEMVDITVEDGPNGDGQRAWGLSFPDLADVAYYSADPITMASDYAVLWGSTHTAFSLTLCNQGYAHYITEIRLPEAGADCPLPQDIVLGDEFKMCYDDLPNPQHVYTGYSEISNVHTYTFEVPFASCGYDFNPYEFQTCRPFTIVSMAVNGFDTCYTSNVRLSVPAPDNFFHLTQKVQISDFPTRSPTESPTMAPSLAPTMAPSIAPSNAPSFSPVHPTATPTPPSNAPTFSPSATPTAKPTNLPTATVSALDFPPCPGLHVKHLNTLFPATQSGDEFNQIPDVIYNRRRVWTNGVLQIHFVDRFEDGGDWVITNNTYSAISITDANFNNPLVYNISDPEYKLEAPNPLPGPYPSGYVYYDHFAHDNILSKPDFEATLYFACINTLYPTAAPLPLPTSVLPTGTPSTDTPTMAPTANCTGFCINTIGQDNCTQNLGDQFIGCYLKKKDDHGHAQWGGVAAVDGYTIFWNVLLNKWTIHGLSGYSVSAPESSAVGRYPPNTATWLVHDDSDFFADTCTIRFTYYCWETGIPTESPTRAPTTALPTTAEPSSDPTNAPSFAPTLAPSTAPSLSPTLGPTGSPIVDCVAFKLSNTSSGLDGMYSRSQSVDALTGRYHWYQIRGDGLIFWSSSTLHESWIINSDTVNQYWLSTTRPYFQPPMYSAWWLYLGSSPFIKDERALQLQCYNTMSPTPEPTTSPTAAPSNAPSGAPSSAPTQPPSTAPTLAPSDAPTAKPTTEAPTHGPTTEPTYIPTPDPTAEPCQYLLMTDPNGVLALDMFLGVYVSNNLTGVSIGWDRLLDGDCLGNPCKYILTTDGSTWRITNNIAGFMNIILEIAGTGIRAPFAGSTWQFESDPAPKTDYALNLDCSETDAPTTAPTMAPSLAPSMAPTSSCKGLYFNNTAQHGAADWPYNQWYSRQGDYDINGHEYWLSADGVTAHIAYMHGHWYLLQKDNDLMDDEDPVMLTLAIGAELLLSPPSGMWLYADDEYAGDDGNASSALVVISCIDSKAPSHRPSRGPTQVPSLYTAPSWADCPEFRAYFAFIAPGGGGGVYWPVPAVNEHYRAVNMTHSPTDMEPGMEMTVPGLYTVEYVATDGRESISCVLQIYVVGTGGGLWYNTSYEYCKKERFYVEIEFNDTYYALEDDGDYEGKTVVVDGIVYDPNMESLADGRRCYVEGRKVSNYETVHVEDAPGKSSFLGMEAVNLLWEILVLLLILVLLCLIGECVYRLYVEKKKKQNATDEQTEKLLASQHLNGESQEMADNEEENEEEEKDEEEKDEEESDSLAHGGDVEMQEMRA